MRIDRSETIHAIAGWIGALAALTASGAIREARGDAGSPDSRVCRTPTPDEDRIAAFLAAGCYKAWPHDPAQRATGPTKAKAPHGRVQVYYSPEILTWVQKGRPAGGIPDGAMIYKEMYAWAPPYGPSGGAYMLKHRGVSFDGWYWGGYSSAKQTAWGAWANGGCLNCHASADTPELTFADLEHLATGTTRAALAARPVDPGASDGDATARMPAHSSHVEATAKKSHQPIRAPTPAHAAAAAIAASDDSAPAPGGLRAPDPRFTAYYRVDFKPPTRAGLALPDEGDADESFSGPSGPDALLTSSNCSACHGADVPDAMAIPAPDHKGEKGWYWDVSPYGEWSTSLMGLSGRDPVFHAQLEREKALRPRAAAFLDDTCYRCHGVMGERQLRIDRNEPFAHEMVFAKPDTPNRKYGVLALDGVSCLVCHRMAESGSARRAPTRGGFSSRRRASSTDPTAST